MHIELKKAVKISLEGSKSIINRMLIISTMRHTSITMLNYSTCNDVKTMQHNLQKLGFDFNIDECGATVNPVKSDSSDVELFINDSATAFRFLLVRLAAWPGKKSVIKLSTQLVNRPHQIVVDLLREMGAEISISNGAYLIVGKKLSGGIYSIDSSISSQYISAILLIAPLISTDLHLILKGKRVSAGYLQMTLDLMTRFGIEVDIMENEISVRAGQKYNLKDSIIIEPDYSSACYFWALGALSNKRIFTKYTLRSLQPDSSFLNTLKTMGADILWEDQRVGIKKGELHGITVDMCSMPDQVPTLAILALFADSPTKMTNINHLKYKETDRLGAIKTELKKLGAKVVSQQDYIKIYPLSNFEIKTTLKAYGDHRMVMAFSILQKIIPSITIDDPKAVSKSYPLFLETINLIS